MSSLNRPGSRIASSRRGQTPIARRRFACSRRNSSPRLEFLEERTLLSIDMVSNSNDSGPGSLRNAIATAGAGDMIEFNMTPGHVTSPITLTTGELTIAQNLKIVGPGASHLTISGNGASTVVAVSTGTNVAISGVTIADGVNGGTGGGVANKGDLKLLDDVLSDNSAQSGGAIYNSTGSLSVTGCTIESNHASNSGFGGGIFVTAGFVTIEDSTFQGNSAEGGGALVNGGGTVSLINSTLTSNSATDCGAIDNASNAELINCTVAGNTSTGIAGGIFNGVVASLTIGNTIIAGNSAGGAASDFDGAVTTDLGNNLIGDTSGSSGFTGPSDLLGVASGLAPLENNGGPTQTMGLTPGSPAIDAGNNALIPAGVGTDQRGFSRIVNGTVDVGAFEVQLYVVDNTNDQGPGSLRAAVTNADQAGGSSILFATTGVITLQSALPAISADVNMVGPGANTLSVSGNAAFQVFDVETGVTAGISGLTITDGSSGGNGGGIENDGTLTLTSCTVSDSSSGNDGGGIFNSGTLTVIASTVSGNTSSNDAGGIENSGTVAVVNSTVADNSANSGQGGGINNAGTLDLVNSTIADNSAFNGGGIQAGGAVTMANTIVGYNTLTGGTGADFDGSISTDSGYNLIADSSGSSGFTQPSDILDVDPLLSALGNYGGPTQTISLLPGSPAIDAGSNALAAFDSSPLTTDQRGDPRINDGIVDIGALETHLFTITILFGDNQSTAVKTDFNVLLTVVLTTFYGEPVEGGIVTFTAPGSGASATFPAGRTIITSPAGTASALAEANTITGSYQVAASSGGAGTKHFNLTNTPGAATQLAIQTQPSATASAGLPFGTQPVIDIEDQYGNLETGDNSTQVTAALATGSGTLEGTTTVTASAGVATFTNLAFSIPDTITLKFTSSPALTSVTSNAIVVTAPPTQLVIETEPSATATAGVSFATQPVVYVEDQYGDLETNDNTTQVTASLASGAGPLNGTVTVTVTGGIATFTNLSDNTAETISLRFTSVPVLTAATSSDIVISPAAASKLAVSTQPSPTATAGVAFSTQPVVDVEDQYGNLEASDNTTQVTATLHTGSGPLLGTTTVTVSGGIATFTDLSDDTAETISLQFTSVPALTSATSNNIDVSSAAATQLVVQTQPSATATAGVAFATQPVIWLEDQYGNLVKGNSAAQVTASALPAGSGPLQGFTTITASNGVVDFSGLAYDTAATIYLHFTSVPALTVANSSNIVVSPAAASQLAIITQPSPTATAGVAFSTQPVVYVEDQYGNLETGDNTTQVSASLNTGSGPLQGTTTETVSGGIATFTNLSDNKAETISLQFTSVPAVTAATSNNIVVSPAAATQLVLITQPSATATAGVAFATQPVVYIEDQYGNVETGDNTTEVTAALNTGSGPLQGTTIETASSGIATFTNLADDKAETISLQFTSVPALAVATSNNIVISPAAASQLAVITEPSPTATAGVAFGTQPVVYVEDQYGNLETGDNATQVTATSLPNGSGPLQGTTTETVSGGIATFTNLADDRAETITLQFSSVPSLAVATSSTIVISPAAATQLALVTEPSATATAGVPFSTQPVIWVEDQYGNIETGDNTTQVTAALNTGSGPLLGTTTETVSGGIATFTNLSDDTAETISLQFTSVPALTAATSNNIVVSPAAATQLVLITQPSSTATAGVAFATQPVVYIEDQYGNLETGDNTTQVTAASLPIGSGPLQGTTTVTASGGIVTFTDLADDTAETISLHFTSSPPLTVLNSNNIVVSPAAASLLAISTQPSPTAMAGVAFGTQPVIWVEDQYGNLETSDNTTEVTAALDLGSGPLQGTTTVMVSGGIATFTNLSDNQAETISLQFTSVPALTAATSNNIVVSPAAATQLVLITQPSATATAGATFATQPVVYIEDQYGNLETGDNSTVVTAALNTGSGPLQGTTLQTAANGIVTFTNLADDKAETISLQFTSVPALAAATSNNIVISPAAASQLAVITQPSLTATAGVAFGTQPVVYVEDPYGNLETGDNATQVTVTSLPLGSGPLLGTTTVTVSGGIATFTNLQDNTAETISLSFSSVPDLTPATSNDIVISPAAATQLALVTEPSATATAGVPFSTQPVIWVEDQYGNVETGDNTTQVTAALNTGSGPLLGTTVLTVSGGVATFTNLADDTAETISLTFTSVPALTAPTSSNIVVSPAAATQLVLITQPSAAATAGVAFATQPVVYIEDQYGNIETGDNATQVTASALPLGSGPLQGTTTVTASAGIVTFTNLTEDEAGTISLQFTSSPALAVTNSNNIVVSPAAASQLAINTQPSPAATAGVAFSTQPVVYIEDQYGNLETSDNTTEVTAALDLGSGPLQGTTTVMVSGGIATFTNLSDNQAETISLQFTSVPALTAATSNNIVVSPAAATQLVLSTQPSATATAGATFATQPVVYIEDQYGNVETGDNTTEVTAALNTGSGPLQGTTIETASSGIATFTNLADDKAETISLQFTSVPALAVATSNNIVISPAAASQLALITEPSSTATAGVAFGTQPVVYVEDQYGNLETGDNATQVTATALPNGSGPLQGTTTETVSGGIATFTNLADDRAETITLQFSSVPSLAVATSSTIVISPAAATQLALVTEPSATATAGVPFSTQPVIWVEDQYGNVETGDNTTQVTAALNTGSGPLLGTTVLTVSGGVATFTNLSDDTAETISLTFTSVPALTAPTSSNIVVSPAAATQLVLITQPSAAATAGVAFATQPVVYIEDQYGNIETGDNTTQVTAAALPLGSGPLQGTTTVTASGGIVTFTNLAENKAGTISLHFTSFPSLAVANSNNVVVSPAAASQLAVSTQPAPTATAGVAFSPQPVIWVEDQYGNLETGDNATQVTAALNTGTGPLQGTTTVTVSGGIATFTNLSDNKAETISLQFTSVPALIAATSNNIVVSPAAATQLILNTQPSPTATAGVPFSTQPVIDIEDQYGNIETGDNSTHVTASALPQGSGPLLGTTTVTAAAGIATFTNLAEDTAETIWLHFTSTPALTVLNSSNIVVSPGAASQLAVSTQPSPTATAGVAFATQPVVYVEDQFGNLETNDNATQVTATSSPLGSGPLHGTTTVTVSGGIATFTDLSDNKAETMSLRFISVPSLTAATSSSIVVSPAAASQLGIHTQPGATTTINVPFSPQPVVYVEDQYGNLETGDNNTQVTASLNTGSGPLLGTTTVTVSGGVATFTNLADPTVETITLRFTSNPELAQAVSNAIVVNQQVPYQLVLQTQPSSSATAGQAFSPQPVIYVEDQAGDLVVGDNTTQVTVSLRTGTGPLLGTTTVTASGGIATFTNLTDDKAESIILLFTASGLVKAQSNQITVSPAAATSLSIVAPTLDTARKPFSATVTAYDPYGNVATGYRGTVHFSSTDRGAVLPANYTFTTGDAGIHTFGNGVTMKTVGQQTITVFDMSNPSITGSIVVYVSPAPAAAVLAALADNGSSAGPAVAAVSSPSAHPMAMVDSAHVSHVRTARADRRRMLARADRARDRVLGGFMGSLHALLMAERLLDGQSD